MKTREKKDVAFAIFSNLFTLVTSVFLGFIVPKFLSVDNYALYKTFSLYAGFVGFFHFGFINGIYLKYGNLEYEQLPQKRFAGFSWVLFLSQLIIQGILTVVLFSINGYSSFSSPFLYVIVNIVLINLNSYFTHINQFTKRFAIDAWVLLLQYFILLIGTLTLLVLRQDSYIYYVGVVTLGNLIVLVIQLHINRKIVFVKKAAIQVDFGEIKDRISHGFFIMISEFMGIFVVTIDSVIVNLFLSAKDFSAYALAVAVITVLYQLTTFLSKLIFPFLKRVNESDYCKVYRDMMWRIMAYSFSIGGIAFIAALIVPVFLPDYSNSAIIIRILGLTVLFKGVQELLCANFYKTLNMERSFARINFIAIIVATLSDVIAFWIFRSKESVAIASVVSFGIWFIMSDVVLKRKLKLPVVDTNSLLFLLMIILYSVCIVLSPVIGITLYYGLLIIIVFAFLMFNRKTKNKMSSN